MGLTITLLSASKEEEPMWISPRRLFLTADKERVVEDGDIEARYLLVGKGGEVPMADAERYGLLKPKPEEKAVEEPPEDKAVEPPKNKAVKRGRNKKR
jgi:hypothetical protein